MGRKRLMTFWGHPSGLRSRRRAIGRRVGTAGAVASACVGLAACGSGSSSSGAVAPGGTINVMTASSVTGPVPSPQYPVVAQAAVKWINAHGGIDGHQLKLTTCDDQTNPNGASACVQRMVSNNVVACVGCNTLAGADGYLKRMQPRNIAWFGPDAAQTPGEMSNPMSFPLSFAFLINSASASKAVPPTCHTTNLAIIEFPGTPEYVKYIRAGAELNGGSVAKTVLLPIKPGDYSSQAVQLMSNHPDCINIAGGQSNYAALLPALKQLGVNGDKVRLFSSGLLDETVCKDFYDSVCKNAQGAMPFTTYSSKVWDDYRAALAQYGGGRLSAAQQQSEQGLTVWAAYMAFRSVLERAKLKSITSKSFIDAANRDSAVDTGGETPTLDFTKPFPVRGYERIFNRSAALRHLVDDRYVANGGFVDMTPVLKKVAADG